jgi:glyoxylase-like metal-dependent hydrolase (beta-lactamase superfamily II)
VERVALSDTLTFWTAPHPAWKPNPEWPEDVGFATWESADAYVFVDPLVRDDRDPTAWERFDAAAARRQVAVLLTAPWHERSVRAVSGRYQAPVWIHPRGRARVEGLPELKQLPIGVEAFVPEGVDEGQVAFHIVPERALVVAEFFLGTATGLRVMPSPGTQDPEAFAASLGRLRELPIERVLVAHGPPVFSDGQAAIRAALDAFARS